MSQFVFSKELVDAIVLYLAKRPYEEVVNIVFEKFYLRLPVFQKNSLVRWPITH